MVQTFKLIGLLILAGFLGIIGMVVHNSAPRINLDTPMVQNINSFEECAAAGNPIMESYPRQCRTPDGRNFVENIAVEADPSEGYIGQPNGCAVAGCSGQLCVSADEAGDIVTTCEYRAEYACYRSATCERQANGQCGWTSTAELQQCLANPPALDSATDLQVL